MNKQNVKKMSRKNKRKSKPVFVSMKPAFYEALLLEAEKQRRTPAGTANFFIEEELLKLYPNLKKHVKY